MINKLTRPFTAIGRFLGEVRAELALMEWVKGKKLAGYTLVVVVYSVSLTILIYVFDLVLVAVRNGLLGSTTL